MKKKNGFAFIELLVVVVVFSTVSTVNIIKTSERRSFKDEVLSISKSMETAFAEKWSKGNDDISSNKIQQVTIDGKEYSYLCMTINDLYNEHYIFTNRLSGYFQMFVENHDSLTYVSANNGKYMIQGNINEVAKSDYELIEMNSTVIGRYRDTNCPLMLPTKLPSNN